MKVTGIVAVALLFAITTQAEAQRAKRAMGPSLIGDPGQWFTEDAYPPEAIRENRSGRVVVDIGVDSAGKPISCQVKVSSDTDALDKKTCAIALERGHFDPARDRKGHPIASDFLLPVRWVLPDSPHTIDLDKDPVAQNLETELTISADGVIVKCRVISQKPAPSSPAQDACKNQQPGTETHTIFTKNGKPVGVVVENSISASVKPLTPAQ